MATQFELSVMSPDRPLFEGRAEGLIAPGALGYLGVLARHAPMVAELGPGVLTVVEGAGQRRLFAVSGGFLEVNRDKVTVLADAVEGAEEIDAQRARAAETRARDRLRSRADDVDVARAEAALRRALARLEVVEKSRRSG
ncbi:MAG: F0F1 ATP synthase subunit epsilon [Armatimonadota bacterium]